MYSNRRSPRNPGSFHTPCTPQFVLTMQNAEPHEASTALDATTDATAAASAACRLNMASPYRALSRRPRGGRRRAAGGRRRSLHYEESGGAREPTVPTGGRSAMALQL